ncbi:MAG: hypothetical protein JNK82_31010 [Myxococcaceae bacterium]|nr:hypothetical protein [Myxococcaceae bacterium]
MTPTVLALAASLLFTAEGGPADIDKLWDGVVEIALSQRKCPDKGGDETCTWLRAFSKGTLPAEYGAAQFGLPRPRYVDDGTFVEGEGAHLVYGGKPVHLFGLGPDDANEAKKMVELAAAYWKGAKPATDKLTTGVIDAAKGGLGRPVPPALHYKRGARTEQVRPGNSHDVFAVRVFEKKLYLLSLTETKKKSADGSPPLSIAAFGLSAP